MSDLDLTPMVCDECGRHVPVYLIHDPDTGEAVGMDIAKQFCKACAPDVLKRWMSQ